MFFRIFHRFIQKCLNSRISLEIILYILCCFFSCNAQILTQTKWADSVYYSKVYSLCISSLQIRYFIKWNMEYLRCRNPMNISCLSVCLNQLFIPWTVCQYTQFNLRIIRIYKNISFFRDKHLSKQSSKFCPDWNILQVRFCTANTSGSRDRLIKGSMYSSVCLNKTCKSVCISRFQFC